jgi:hypothetical protein
VTRHEDLSPELAAKLDDCITRGLVPPDFEPQGDNEREKMNSLSARATVGWHQKYRWTHLQGIEDYVPRSQRLLWNPNDPSDHPPVDLDTPKSQMFDLMGEAERLAKEKDLNRARDLPRGDAYEPPDA